MNEFNDSPLKRDSDVLFILIGWTSILQKANH